MWNNKYVWYRVIYKFYIVLTSAGDIDNGLSQLDDIKKAIINFKSQLKMKAILVLLLLAFAFSLLKIVLKNYMMSNQMMYYNGV